MKNKLLIQQNISFGNPGQITFRGGNNIDNLVNKTLYWDSIVNLNTGLVGSLPARTLKHLGEKVFSKMLKLMSSVKVRFQCWLQRQPNQRYSLF